MSCGDLEHLAPSLQQREGGLAGARMCELSRACPDGRRAPSGDVALTELVLCRDLGPLKRASQSPSVATIRSMGAPWLG